MKCDHKHHGQQPSSSDMAIFNPICGLTGVDKVYIYKIRFVRQN